MFLNGEGVINLDVPGPVLDAWLVWTGTADETKGVVTDPTVSDLIVNGTPIIGVARDQYRPATENPIWYNYFANVGPNGAGLVGQGANTLNISKWGPLFSSTPEGRGTRRNGASLVVVYDTTPCTRANAVYVFDHMDWAFFEQVQYATDVIAVQFDPANRDRTARVWSSIAGIDHTQIDRGVCRGIRFWFEQGPGAPPDNLLQKTWPESVGVNGGDVLADDIWNPSPPCTPAIRPPATGVSGGYSEGTGDYGSALLAVTVPAGATHFAYQLESETPIDPTIQPPFLGGESFMWVGAASPFVIDIPSPDLTVSKSDGVDEAAPGDTLTYTLDYANTGDGDGADVVLQDTLPDWVTFVSASDGGSESGGVVTWNLGTLPAGASGSVQVTVQVDAQFPAAGVYTLENSASISTSTPGDDPANNNASDTTSVTAKPELTLSKTAGPDPVPAGDQVTYTFNWSVGGSAPAVALTLSDPVPTDTTFVSASDGGTEAGGVVTWNLGDQNPGASGSVTMIVQTATPLENGLAIANTAELSESGFFNVSTTADASVTISSSHTLTTSKVAEPEPVEAGAQLTYTISYEAQGNSPTGQVVLTDTLPAHTSFVSASDGGSEAGGVVTWDLGDLLPRASGTTQASGSVTLVVQVDTPLINGLILENTATLSDADPETPPADTGIVTSTVHSDHLLHLSKTADPAVEVEKGGLITFTLDISITGNEPAPNVVLRDVIPFGTQFVSASGGGMLVPPAVVWNLGDIDPPYNSSVTFVVRVNKTLPNGIDIDNTAVLSDDDPETDAAQASVTVPVKPTPPPASIGDDVFADVNNNGVRDPGEPGFAGVPVTLSDPGADGVCDGGDTVLASAVTNGDGQYLFANLEPGSYCVAIDATAVPAGYDLGASFSNPAGPITVSEGQDYRDADFGFVAQDNTALIGDRVWLDSDKDGMQDEGEAGIAGVTLMLKQAGADGVCGTGDDVAAGSTTTNAAGAYQFAVAPGAYCVMVDETTLPAQLTLTGGDNPHGPIVVNAGDVYNLADFGYGPTDGAFGSIGDFVFFDANRNGVYDPANGEGGIANVTLDLFRAGADGVCGGDDVYAATTTTDGLGNYLFSGLPDGTYCVVVTDTNGVLSDYVQSFGVPDTNNNGQSSPYKAVISGGNDVLTADFSFADGHILSLRKGDSPDPVEAGDLLVYSITYSVSGREPAPNVMLKDTIPAHTSFVSATNGGTESGGVVTWMLGTLNPGDSGTVQVTVRVDTPLVNGTFLRNGIAIMDDSGLTVTDFEDTRVHSAYAFTLSKSDAPDPVTAGENLVYTINYEVTGNAPATDVVIEDALPAHTSFVSASNGGVENGGVVTWNLGTLLPPSSGSVTLTVKPDRSLPTGSVITNSATISGKEGPTATAETSTDVIGIPILELSKTASVAGPVILGDVYSYELCYQNAGGESALDTVLVDDLPGNVDYVDGTVTGGGVYDAANHRLSWNLGTLTPGSNACVSFDVKVARTIASLNAASGEVIPYKVWANLTLLNTATISASNADPATAQHELILSSIVNPGIFKAVDKSKVIATEELEFTLSVTNDGNAPGSGMVVTDQLSTYLENIRVTTSQGSASYDANTHTVTVDLGSLDPGAVATITIKARVKWLEHDLVPLFFTNSAVVSFNEGNPRESNIVQVEVDGSPPPNEIPEPATLILLGSGLAGLAGWARRRRNLQA